MQKMHTLYGSGLKSHGGISTRMQTINKQNRNKQTDSNNNNKFNGIESAKSSPQLDMQLVTSAAGCPFHSKREQAATGNPKTPLH